MSRGKPTIIAVYYQGQFVYPTSIADIKPFLARMGQHIYDVSYDISLAPSHTH
jgi:hypothetical protein